jgi:hypothetical protein
MKMDLKMSQFTMLRYDIYDIYLLQMGFHPVAAVGKLVQKRDSYIQMEIQYTKQYKTQNTQNTKPTYKTRKQTQKEY